MKSSLPLTAKYRPQLFSEVAGQSAAKHILSRAAAENKVAPAYLFSGTRGVGKTTIARIFAKALNCERGPAPEPCNCCESCRQITQGIAVDVHEIDGASNRGIDDAKRLKEDIGYAPLEGRYKVFIIDEAHMLTREAFNALLKTLEEPPSKVTFILATTEPHKFPSTIISRCQHFLFKQLNPQELREHLSNVLKREAIEFEEEAVNLLARRAAGSVRDGMSLLGQVLALGQNSLKVADVEEVLGLAGQDLFLQIVDATARQNVLQMSGVVEVLLDQGVDMGFFLRELTLLWRNLFMLRHSGEAALKLLDLSREEGRIWIEAANRLDLAHLHAAWQLTLEGQRRVLASLEPGQALELLLLNIALLPALLPVSGLPDTGGKSPVNLGGGLAAAPQTGTIGVGQQTDASTEIKQIEMRTRSTLNSNPQRRISVSEEQTGSGLESAVEGAVPSSGESNQMINSAAVSESMPSPIEDAIGLRAGDFAQNPADVPPDEVFPELFNGLNGSSSGTELSETSRASGLMGNHADFQQVKESILPPVGCRMDAGEADAENGAETAAAKPVFADLALKETEPSNSRQPRVEKTEHKRTVSPIQRGEAEEPGNPKEENGDASPGVYLSEERNAVFSNSLAVLEWKNFLEFCRQQRKGSAAEAGSAESEKVLTAPLEINEEQVEGVNPALLDKGRGAMNENCLLIECPSDIAYEYLCRPEQRRSLSTLAERFWGKAVELKILPPLFKAKTRGDLRREAQVHPAVILLKEKMGAYLLDCAPEFETY